MSYRYYQTHFFPEVHCFYQFLKCWGEFRNNKKTGINYNKSNAWLKTESKTHLVFATFNATRFNSKEAVLFQVISGPSFASGSKLSRPSEHLRLLLPQLCLVVEKIFFSLLKSLQYIKSLYCQNLV